MQSLFEWIFGEIIFVAIICAVMIAVWWISEHIKG